MKKVTITFLIVILISLSACNISNAQVKDFTELPELSFKKKRQFSIKPADDYDNIKNLPFQFGLELGTTIIRENEFVNVGFIGSMDINLSNRLTFLRFELGVFSINADRLTSFNEEDTKAPAYASLGINVRAITIGKSRFFTSLSLGVITDYWPFPVFALKYVYNVNRYLGFTSSVRYPFYGRSPFISAGLQFTN